MSGVVRRPPSATEIWRAAAWVWLSLLALVALTLTLAYVPMGSFNTASAIGIASLKALLVALFFMHLRRPTPLLRLAGAATLLWLFIMFTLTFADVLARQ